MPKKPKSMRKRKSKKTDRSPITKQKPTPFGLKQISVHPRLAAVVSSLKQFTADELEELKRVSSEVVAAGASVTGCWISDTGGQQHCVNLPPDVCTRQGGISVPTRCPIN